ncbi:PQ loop repeat-domain-containing protein [Catenaria anguillulae PL171]|uniref:PQ loop repeat-domain-containing protein n=1 Tax=Catenaria anguillulae PL171 TaxID=765915 RepID=A0A1Y2HNB0_9FUNG|nr:PQ loop repeat-domain-containing protein [Catenaria anguillulae PL171]
MSLAAASTTSSVLGWGYFVAWSVSFWPQFILNWQRKSVEGLSLDYVWLNVVGFGCYSVYTVSFYCWPLVQNEFKRRNEGRENLIAVHDLFFAVHAWAVCILTAIQAVYYKKPEHTMTKPGALIVAILCAVTVGDLIYTFLDFNARALDLMYVLGMVKLTTTLTKYIPQLYMNFRDKSTEGWSVAFTLLDTSGSVMGLAQLFLDAWIAASIAGDTSAWFAQGVAGNVTKFGLGAASLFFDTGFLIQHFLLYRGNLRPKIGSAEEVVKIKAGALPDVETGIPMSERK